MNTLLAWDRTVFYWINHSWANPVMDAVLPVLTDFDHWRIPVIVGLLALAVWGKGRGRVTVVMLAVAIALSDQTSAGLIKPLVGRIRPCNALEDVRLLIPRSGAFSFPSAHAANITAAAFLLSVRYPRIRLVWIGIAVLVCLSRVYVGIHYPLDVLGGAVAGLGCAAAVVGVQGLAAPRLAKWNERRKRRLDGTML
ncbi:MAG: phosphatase PAP2 family protein [Candidatus Eisenbacteria sp.]|nr:phosphatase PAP2 family protein [Candidatus Eisenbacteria bacterium]